MGLCGVHVLTAMVDGRDKEAFQSMYGREGLKALSMSMLFGSVLWPGRHEQRAGR